MDTKVKKNLVYNFAYQILAVILPLITTPYTSRVLGPTKLGEYSYSYAIGYYFVMITMLGLNNYGNRTVAAVRDNKHILSKEFCSIYIMQLITGLISITAYIIYGLIFSNEIMSWIIGLYVLSSVLDVNWFLFGLEQFKITVTRNFIIKILTTICIFVFVKDKGDIYIYAIIMVVGITISQLVIWPFVRKNVSFVKVTPKDVLKHVKPNLVLFVPIIAVSLYKVMDKIMLGIMANKTEVGLYESSERIIQIPMALIQSVGTVMLPRMTSLAVKHDKTTSQKYMVSTIVLVMFLSSSLCFGIMGVSRFFVPIYYGAGYDKCIVLFQILLPSCVFLAFANVIRTQYLIPNHKDRIFISSVIIGAIVNLTINAIVIPKLQSYGAAIGTLIAEIVVCAYQAIKVRNEVEIKVYIKKTIGFVVSGLIMYILLLLLEFNLSPLINMFLLIPIGAFIYFFVAIMFIKLTKQTYAFSEYIEPIKNKFIKPSK